MSYAIEQLPQFGAVISNTGSNRAIDQFSPEQIRNWISQYKLIVFRGYDNMPKQELALFGQKLGKPLQWVFGAINDLKVKADAENYIFTDHDVPMHWDGAFAGKIPHIILFQCIIAPNKADMGGTTFADTQKILQHASPATIKEWEKVSITYTTKKVVHYGGQITQKLIDRHPEEGTMVMRYAEPVNDLNPVSLNVKGLEGKTQDEFVAEIKEQLYAPENLYTHRWEAGDIVLADNHTLLHGREAFMKANERYIQRINIMHRPEGFSLSRFISNSLTIRRKEFFVAELPIFLIPLLLNIHSLSDLARPMLYAGLLAIILLFNIGDMINCYADYELDAIYKSHLSNAVYELGKKNVRLQIILSGILAILLTAVVAAGTNRMYLLYMTLAGTFIGLQYSIKPFKFKSRGLWQLLCLWGIIFFGPMLYTAIIADGFPGWAQLVMFAAYGMHQMGIIMLNTAEDYTEDVADGLNTIIVTLGLHRAMNFAYRMVILFGITMLACGAYVYQQAQLPTYLYATLSIFALGWAKILLEYKQIISKINKLNEEEAIKVIKKNGMMVPRWLKIGAYSYLAVILVYFIYNISSH
jgi:alpha-ketoglutarate-dependent taurine dioxygenase/4-hydroxybenzoate polyprenyltransferase